MAKRKKYKIKKYQSGAQHYDPYEDLIVPSETTTAPIYNIERDKELAEKTQGIRDLKAAGMNPADYPEILTKHGQFTPQQLSPEMFQQSYIGPPPESYYADNFLTRKRGATGKWPGTSIASPDFIAGLDPRRQLANLSNWMQSTGGSGFQMNPLDVASEFTLIPAASRIFGDPSRGREGAISQVASTIKDDPNKLLSPSAYTPLLDFLPAAAVGGKPLLNMLRGIPGQIRNLPTTFPQAVQRMNPRAAEYYAATKNPAILDQSLRMANYEGKHWWTNPHTANRIKRIEKDYPVLAENMKRSIADEGWKSSYPSLEGTKETYLSHLKGLNPLTGNPLSSKVSPILGKGTYGVSRGSISGGALQASRYKIGGNPFMDLKAMQELHPDLGLHARQNLVTRRNIGAASTAEGRAATGVHEGGHGITAEGFDELYRTNPTKYKEFAAKLREPFDLEGVIRRSGKGSKTTTKGSGEILDYMTGANFEGKGMRSNYILDPQEIWSRIVEIRRDLMLKPGQKVTADDIMNYQSSDLSGGVAEMMYTLKPGKEGWKEFAKLMNYLPAATGAVAVGSEVTNYKNGGQIMKYGIGGVVENNPDAEIEGGEIILTQQGAPKLDNMSGLKQLSPNAFEVVGKSHGEGGVLAKFGQGETTIISNEYAKEMKTALALLENGDKIEKTQAKRDIDRIVNTQQSSNGNKTNVMMAKQGSQYKKYQHGGSHDSGFYLDSLRDRIIGTPIIPGMNFESDATRTTSPLLDERFVQESLRNQPGRETPFNADEILNPWGDTYLSNTRDQGSRVDTTAQDYDLFLDRYRSQFQDYGETPIRNEEYIENVIPGAAGGTQAERDSASYWNNFLNSYRMAGMEDEPLPVERRGARNIKYEHGGMHYPSGISSSADAPSFDIQSLYGMRPGAFSNLDRSMTVPRFNEGEYTGNRTFPLGHQYNKNLESGAYLKDGGRLMKGQGGFKNFLSSLGGMFGGGGGGGGGGFLGGLGSALGAVAPFASGIYNLVAPMFQGDPEMYDPKEFYSEKIDPIQESAKIGSAPRLDPYAQTAPQMQLAATAMNNYTGPQANANRQATLSSMAPSIGQSFAQTEFMNQQSQFETDKFNVGIDMANLGARQSNAGIDASNKAMDWQINQYNDMLASLKPGQTATGVSQLSNAFAQQDFNQTLQGLSNTSNYNMGQYGGGNQGEPVYNQYTGEKLV